MKFAETPENEDKICILKELQDIVSALRVTSSLLLTLIINEDEDNLLALNTTGFVSFDRSHVKRCSAFVQMFSRCSRE